MDLLRGLRLNCFLVPGIMLAVSLVVLGATLLLLRGRQREALDAAALAPVRCAAELGAPPARLLTIDRTCVYAAVIEHDGGGQVRCADAAGQAAMFRADDPAPELIGGFLAGVTWHAGGRLLAAHPLPAREDGVHRLLYVERPAPTVATADLLVGSLVLLAGLGGLLALYGTRHLYRPVESLCEEVAAALEGREPRTHLRLSPETVGLAASVSALTQRFRAEVLDAPTPLPGPD